MFTNKDHTFVICAYKESPFLEECINSLLNQTIKSNIIIETSTPNNYIETYADKYGIKVFINNNGGLARDWNFGYNNAETKLVTIAHQDDVYDEDYVENILKYANKSNDPIIIFTDYYEIRNGKKTPNNLNLIIKRIMNNGYKRNKNQYNQKFRRRVLSFGDSISCPTVTLVKTKCGASPYNENFQCSADYKTWSELSKLNGSFVYVPKKLMGHRIYEESTTTESLKNNVRQAEDASILMEYWPKPIANLIYKIYSNSEKSNNI